MDEKRTLLNYIGPGAVLTLLCVVLLAAALLCAFYTPPKADFVPQYPPAIPDGTPSFEAGEDGSLVYLDTIAVSDAICESADGRLCYAAEDDSHRFYVVCVSGETYALMGAQRNLWNAPDSPASFIRLSGRRMPIPEEVKQGFLQVFAMDGEVFDGNFGLSCLVEELQVVPVVTRSPLWTVLAVIFSLAFLAAAALWLLRALAAWSAIVPIEESGRLSDAVAQLDEGETIKLRDDRLRLSRDFLYGWRVGLASAWEDVVWSYERSFSVGSSVLSRALVVCTADGKTHPLFFSEEETKDMRRLANTLLKRNPKMLWGLTDENRAAWKERTK